MPRPARHDRSIALDKAVDLFWQRGYHATSMKHIEQALDMRPGSLYATFGSKRELFSETLTRYAQWMGEELAQCLAAEGNLVAGFQQYLRNLAGPCLVREGMPPRACMVIKTLLEVNAEEPALQQQANQVLDQMEKLFTEQLTRAQAQGELRAEVDCARLARLLQGQVIGLRSFAQRDTDPAHIEALAEDMGALFLPYLARSSA
ncbi:TetR/AcrR family transcriptional regulator [Halopseudomonas sabulinigri]|uniref:DNA-binding transcriptional regulator, AcrR family n=1 Tax=Halopseudomonas sabulinigri TaxID=472181 RepID=A0A1H1TIV8_9GAMM|nr:TetR/AcrR family transcriptional regulator [Halopseudomonas sabulinigri]SDS60150.1 DNA-binding transcriptional regulator, AcrR family [Halopseudomonas sabulinigri]